MTHGRWMVTGGRDFCDLKFMCDVFGQVATHRGYWPDTIVHGNACGADWLAKSLTKFWGMAELPFVADWKGQGRSAGMIRNQRMLDNGGAELLIAFPGGRGTNGMVEITQGVLPVFDYRRGVL